MGQFTPFDMLLVVLLGNAVQNALLGKDTSVAGGLLLAVTLISLNWSVGFLSARSEKVEALIAVSYTHLDVYKRQPPRRSTSA